MQNHLNNFNSIMSFSDLVDQWTDERIDNYLKSFCFFMQV